MAGKTDGKPVGSGGLKFAAAGSRIMELPPNEAFVIGEQVFIRTVTYHTIGRIVGIKGDFLVLDEATWVAESGRFTQTIEEGALNEIEPVPGLVRVNVHSIVDVFVWAHALPRQQK